MKENPEFIGRSYTQTEKEDVTKTLQNWSDEALKPIEGEFEKTEEEIKLIEAINLLINSELESIGIETYSPISPEKVHILSGKIFKEMFPDFDGQAFFRSTDDVVYLNKDKTTTKARLFSTLLHELIHRASTTKFYIDNDGGVYDARVGYRIRSPWKEPEDKNQLVGFNELVTDFTVYKILLKNQDFLKNSIGITNEDIQGPIYSYMHYGPIMDSIIKKISLDKNISPLKVFDNLERGQFLNNILVLKDVEKSFGKGSLKILSLLETLKEKEDNDTLEVMIKEFFAEENETERQSMYFKINTFVNSCNR